ncbi:MAG: DNA-binding protein [Candidatus Abyssobacteria bacterium SURF_17]|jgi:hypothetical protein|uniref:DNA-binding protein n=1 Tax=Candidatus Abyssobacteria bacterium SURF_17 TaxID=2093361 RepID=A0A419EUI4_9BACT|nr:MAG: DNA-binding protein [Candidatus Abyssubacteria bacterium SURF_17]
MPRTADRQDHPKQRLYDLKDAATYLGRTVWGVRELIWSGQLPVVRSGRKQFVDVRDMEAYIERNKVCERKAAG